MTLACSEAKTIQATFIPYYISQKLYSTPIDQQVPDLKEFIDNILMDEPHTECFFIHLPLYARFYLVKLNVSDFKITIFDPKNPKNWKARSKPSETATKRNGTILHKRLQKVISSFLKEVGPCIDTSLFII